MRPLASAAASSPLEPPQLTQVPPEKKPRTTTALACSACRRRKTKCNGLNPCAQCESKGTDCAYEHRPRPHEMQTALRDKDAELRSYQRFVAALKVGTHADAHALIDRLRDSGQMDDAVQDFQDDAQGGSQVEDSDSTSNASPHDIPLGWFQSSPPHSPSPINPGQINVERLRRADWHPALQFLTSSTPFTPYLPNRAPQMFEPIPVPSSLTPQPFSLPMFPQNQQQWSAMAPPQSFSSDVSTEWEEFLEPHSRVQPSRPPLSGFAGNSLFDTIRDQAAASAQTQQHSAKDFPLDGRLQIFGNLPMSKAVLVSGYSEEVGKMQMRNFELPEYLIMPLSLYENTAVGGRWIEFRNQARTSIMTEMYPIEQILGTDEVCVDLAFRERRPSDLYTVAAFVCELVDIYQCPDRMVGLAYIALMTRLMRWMVHPTRETYARVPDIMKPTLAQRLIPRPAVVDTIVFCGFRDRMIIDLEDYVTDLICKSSIPWPYQFSDAVHVNPVSGTYTLSQRFESYISEPSNWALTSDCLEQFPFLKTQVQINLEGYPGFSGGPMDDLV